MKFQKIIIIVVLFYVFGASTEAVESISRKWTTSDGVTLHYLEQGEGSPILFVPGWTMPATIWIYQLTDLSSDFRVIAMDPRSQGNSHAPPDGHYPERRAQDIYELIQHLELENVILIGWSLGVVEVLTYVELYGTSFLKGVVLVDGFIGADPSELHGQNPLVSVLTAIQVDRASFTELFVRGMFRKPQDEKFIRELIRYSLKTPTNSAFTLLGNLIIRNIDMRNTLEKLNVPAIYIVTPQLAQQAAIVREINPEIEVHIFENAGHALFVDEREKFNLLLCNFIVNL